MPEEIGKESLDDYRMALLKELKEWLWHKRVKAREERGRAERARAKAEAEARHPSNWQWASNTRAGYLVDARPLFVPD